MNEPRRKPDPGAGPGTAGGLPDGPGDVLGGPGDILGGTWHEAPAGAGYEAPDRSVTGAPGEAVDRAADGARDGSTAESGVFPVPIDSPAVRAGDEGPSLDALPPGLF